MVFNKPPLSIGDQIDLWERRGLSITDKTKAAHYLSNISYYRFSSYTIPFQNNRTLHTFDFGTTFDQILEVYAFDRALRVHLFDAIERIEVSLRARVLQQMAMKHGPHWHQNRDLFKPVPYGGRDVFQSLERHVMQVCSSDRKEVFIDHYLNTYKDPPHPASWMCFETITISTLSRIFKALKDNSDKQAIGLHFRLPHHVLESWLHSIAYVRNICAHHGRLWNRELGVSPLYLNSKKIGPWMKYPYPPNDRVYYVICCIRYMMQAINPKGSFAQRTKDLLAKYNGVPLAHMGFVADWDKEALWQ